LGRGREIRLGLQRARHTSVAAHHSPRQHSAGPPPPLDPQCPQPGCQGAVAISHGKRNAPSSHPCPANDCNNQARWSTMRHSAGGCVWFSVKKSLSRARNVKNHRVGRTWVVKKHQSDELGSSKITNLTRLGRPNTPRPRSRHKHPMTHARFVQTTHSRKWSSGCTSAAQAGTYPSKKRAG
jgi:hypothetical protein